MSVVRLGPAQVFVAPLGTDPDDLEAWRSVGTIDGGELVDLGVEDGGEPMMVTLNRGLGISFSALLVPMKLVVGIDAPVPASPLCQNPRQHDGHFFRASDDHRMISCSGNR